MASRLTGAAFEGASKRDLVVALQTHATDDFLLDKRMVQNTAFLVKSCKLPSLKTWYNEMFDVPTNMLPEPATDLDARSARLMACAPRTAPPPAAAKDAPPPPPGKLSKKQQAELRDREWRQEQEAHMSRTAQREGVVATPTGLLYRIIRSGPPTGATASGNDTVVVNYRGRLTSGQEFDASFKTGGPVSLPVGGVISGWSEALQLMRPGDKWELHIPPSLGYGDSPPVQVIPKGSVLIFDCELVSLGSAGKKK
eukprot:gnl/Spiro4/27297_TR13588_c0_g1_i1.p1 gnl/Spiro4/27297_TR13588_c0_g1~~gnl/Spiro4/27297_TR13588_c0_g1_i1.p1  ORF type:complete len:280 (-),score=66.26 gnl/Spiro4/27297_TR13588_c0_g1_i1:48-809(-)